MLTHVISQQAGWEMKEVVLGIWLIWTFLSVVGHIIVSFEQSIRGPFAWLEGGAINIIQII